MLEIESILNSRNHPNPIHRSELVQSAAAAGFMIKLLATSESLHPLQLQKHITCDKIQAYIINRCVRPSLSPT